MQNAGICHNSQTESVVPKESFIFWQSTFRSTRGLRCLKCNTAYWIMAYHSYIVTELHSCLVKIWSNITNICTYAQVSKFITDVDDGHKSEVNILEVATNQSQIQSHDLARLPNVTGPSCVNATSFFPLFFAYDHSPPWGLYNVSCFVISYLAVAWKSIKLWESRFVSFTQTASDALRMAGGVVTPTL